MQDIPTTSTYMTTSQRQKCSLQPWYGEGWLGRLELEREMPLSYAENEVLYLE